MNRSSRTLVFCSLIGIGLFSLVNALPSSVGIEGVETINKLRAEDWLRNQIGYVVGETSTPSGERLGVSPPCAPKDGGKQKPQIPTGRTPVSNPESAPGDSPNSENPKPNTANESLAPLSPLHPIFSDILFTSLAAEAEGAELVGLTVQMDLPELGLTGEAILTDIQTTPRIEAPLDYRDERQVVTATFRHSSGDVIDLVVADSRSFLPGRTFAAGEPAGQERKAENGKPNTADAGCESLNSSAGDAQQVAASREVLSGREDQQEAASDSPLSAFGSPLSPACEVGHSNREPAESEETIGTTSNHPFWSVDRQEFVQAGSLEIGERLQTLSGDVKVVQQKLPRPGPQPVFNLEVHNEHVYFVGEDGVLVHNAYPLSATERGWSRDVRRRLNNDLKDLGVAASDRRHILNNIRDNFAEYADIRISQSSRDRSFWRFWDGVDADEVGRYGTIGPRSDAYARRSLAIRSDWNALTNRSRLTIQKGSVIVEWTTAPKMDVDGVFLPGGGHQLFVPNKANLRR